MQKLIAIPSVLFGLAAVIALAIFTAKVQEKVEEELRDF